MQPIICKTPSQTTVISRLTLLTIIYEERVEVMWVQITLRAIRFQDDGKGVIHIIGAQA